MTLSTKIKTIPDILAKIEEFPADYVNDVQGWGFDEETILSNCGRLLTLDLDFGSRCSLNCPFCFRRNNSVDSGDRQLGLDDLVKIVTEAKELGLKSVKLLGAGEPLENPGIIDFLRVLRDLDIIPVVFSKTGVLGDDDIACRLFRRYGIRNANDLVDELYRCGTSVVLGFNSFSDHIQKEMTGGAPQIIKRRNRALELLAQAGFNQSNPTRLALGINPITKQNIGEALAVYKWARLRNIYAVVTPVMISGLTRGEKWREFTPSPNELVNLYTDIYYFNLEKNLTTLDKLLEEGISAYAGGRPCSQTAVGLYVTLNGVVLSCPGCENMIEGSVWDARIKDIWVNSKNYAGKGTYNCKCIAKDGKSIPQQLYQEVMFNLITGIQARCARKTTKVRTI